MRLGVKSGGTGDMRPKDGLKPTGFHVLYIYCLGISQS